jgi:menaquinone-9 beta-reductase
VSDVHAGSRVWDVAIVGARCAGASLAVHLRRAGLSVVLLETSVLASDQPLSTHLIQPPGMDELDVLGIGDLVRDSSPAITKARLAMDEYEITLPYGRRRAAHCLRRSKLDAALQLAAMSAGAELQTESRVVAVDRDSRDRVCGVQVRRRSGKIDSIRARFVVGADGRNSAVARFVAAEEYLAYEGERACYWAYWRRPAAWDPSVLLNSFENESCRVVFPSDEDQLLIASAPSAVRAGQNWRGIHEAAYLADVRSSRRLASMLGDAEPVSRVRVLPAARYFFRTAAGAGWALAGDAGHHKDFVIGFGITDALRDARSLAAAIVEDEELSLDHYWRRRDVERIESYRWGQDLGRANRVNAIERLTVKRGAAHAAPRFGDVIDGRITPYELFPASRVLAWAASAAVRGDLRPIAAMSATAARAFGVGAEKRKRRRLLSPTWLPPARAARRLPGLPHPTPRAAAPRALEVRGRALPPG